MLRSEPVFAVTTLPRSTSRCPARPSMGARISVYASWSRALSTAASLARMVARAFSTAAWPARTAARACARVASAAAMAALPFSTIAWSARSVAGRRLHGGPDLIGLLAGDVALADQLRVAPILGLGVLELRLVAHDVGFGLAELRLGLGQRGLGLLDGRLIPGGVGLGLARLGLIAGHVGLGLLTVAWTGRGSIVNRRSPCLRSAPSAKWILTIRPEICGWTETTSWATHLPTSSR